MRPSRPRAVSTYLEVFVLLGVALGGSGLVYSALARYAGSAQGPGITVANAVIRQGRYMATESVAIFNSGQTPVTSFTLSTSGAAASASYCYSLVDYATGRVMMDTCPTLAANPTSLAVSAQLQEGSGVLVEITIIGSEFVVGNQYLVSVTAPGGAQQSVGVFAEAG